MKVLIDIGDDKILDALISGVEGGISYWCRAVEGYASLVRCERVPHSRSEPEALRGAAFSAWCEGGGKLVMFEHDAHDCELGARYVLDGAAIARGLAVLGKQYPHLLADVLDGTGDATTGDALIQCAIFGRLVYG